MTIRVDGEVLPESAIRVELRRLVRFHAEHAPALDLRNRMDSLLRTAKDQAIGGRLLLVEARRRGIRVADEDVEVRIRRMMAEYGGEESFAGMMQRQGLSLRDLRESVRAGLQVDRLVGAVTAGIPEPAEAEAERYYERHREEYRTRDQVKLRHILIQPKGPTDGEKSIARTKLNGLKREIAAGADFAGLARAWSDCPSGKESGGLLGWVARGTAVPALDRAAFSMRVGESSDVFETPLGFHIIQAVDREEGRDASFDEMRDRILDLIRHSRRGHVVAKFVEGLRAAARVEDDGRDIAVDDADFAASGASDSPTGSGAGS